MAVEEIEGMRIDSTEETRSSKDIVRKIEPIQQWPQPIQCCRNNVTASFF